MRTQVTDAANMIRMHVGQNNFPHAAAFTNQLFNGGSQRALLIVIRRTRIDNQKFLRAVNQIAVGVRGRRQRLRSDRKADEAGAKLYTAHGLTISLRDGEKAFDEVAVASFLAGPRVTFPLFLYSALRFPSQLPQVIAVAVVVITLTVVVIIAAEVWRRRVEARLEAA